MTPTKQQRYNVDKASGQNKSEKPFGYPKDIFGSCEGFQKVYTNLYLIIENVPNFPSQCFGYHISDIVSDIRKKKHLSCASPNTNIPKSNNLQHDDVFIQRIDFPSFCTFLSYFNRH